VCSPKQPELDDVAAAINKPIGIKQLLIVTEMARQENDMVTPDNLMACLHTCGF
jgi:vesicle-fusing ATPase